MAYRGVLTPPIVKQFKLRLRIYRSRKVIGQRVDGRLFMEQLLAIGTADWIYWRFHFINERVILL